MLLPDNPKEQVRYEHLLMLEREKGPDYAFFPEGATREYKVSELLDGVRRDLTRPREEPKKETRTPVVILVHGIRTRALWQNASNPLCAKKVLSSNRPMTSISMCCAFYFPVNSLGAASSMASNGKSDTRSLKTMRQPVRSSRAALARTFVSRILRERTDLEFDRTHLLRQRCAAEFSLRGLSQALQQAAPRTRSARATSGRHRRGRHLWLRLCRRYGFLRPAVQDRRHNGMAHGDFLNAEFCRKYWLPFLRDGTIVEDPEAAEPPPWVALGRLDLRRFGTSLSWLSWHGPITCGGGARRRVERAGIGAVARPARDKPRVVHHGAASFNDGAR